MNEKNYKEVLEDAAVDVKKAHAVLFAVCTSIKAGNVLSVLMPALWDTVHKLCDISENLNKALEADADNSGEE